MKERLEMECGILWSAVDHLRKSVGRGADEDVAER